MARENCCAVIHLKEDNARFILLILFLVTYILVGAVIFSKVESEKENEERESYIKIFNDFKYKYINLSEPLNESALLDMLNNYTYAKIKGIMPEQRPRWDFPGAFYFVATVVSTIGEYSGQIKSNITLVPVLITRNI